MTLKVGNRQLVKSAGRALAVFEYFAENRHPASTKDIATGLDWPQSSTSFLLRSLAALGYLVVDAKARTYYPSPRFALLGNWLGEELFPKPGLSETMAWISQETGETVVLAMQSEVQAEYIQVVVGPSGLQVPLRSGMRRPLGRAAVGKILLSLKPDEEIRTLVRRINAEEQTPGRLEISSLLDEIGECRSRGYARSNGSIYRHTDSIAMNVPLPAGQPPLAIAVGGSRERLRKRQSVIINAMNSALHPYHQNSARSGSVVE